MPSKSRPNSANAKHRPLNATIDRLTRSNDALQLQQQLSGIRLRGRPGSSPGRIWGKGGVLPRVGSLKGKLPVDLSGEVRGEGGNSPQSNVPHPHLTTAAHPQLEPLHTSTALHQPTKPPPHIEPPTPASPAFFLKQDHIDFSLQEATNFMHALQEESDGRIKFEALGGKRRSSIARGVRIGSPRKSAGGGGKNRRREKSAGPAWILSSSLEAGAEREVGVKEKDKGVEMRNFWTEEDDVLPVRDEGVVDGVMVSGGEAELVVKGAGRRESTVSRRDSTTSRPRKSISVASSAAVRLVDYKYQESVEGIPNRKGNGAEKIEIPISSAGKRVVEFDVDRNTGASSRETETALTQQRRSENYLNVADGGIGDQPTFGGDGDQTQQQTQQKRFRPETHVHERDASTVAKYTQEQPEERSTLLEDSGGLVKAKFPDLVDANSGRRSQITRTPMEDVLPKREAEARSMAELEAEAKPRSESEAKSQMLLPESHHTITSKSIVAAKQSWSEGGPRALDSSIVTTRPFGPVAESTGGVGNEKEERRRQGMPTPISSASVRIRKIPPTISTPSNPLPSSQTPFFHTTNHLIPLPRLTTYIQSLHTRSRLSTALAQKFDKTTQIRIEERIARLALGERKKVVSRGLDRGCLWSAPGTFGRSYRCEVGGCVRFRCARGEVV